MNKLSKELQETILCKVDIKYGRDKDGHKNIQKVRDICQNTYGLETAIFESYRYCCDDYWELHVSGELPLIKADKLGKAIDLNVTVYYRKGEFIADYDNTYC